MKKFVLLLFLCLSCMLTACDQKPLDPVDKGNDPTGDVEDNPKTGENDKEDEDEEVEANLPWI